MKSYILTLSIILAVGFQNAVAQEITSWKDPETGQEYYRCKDEGGRVMLTDSRALCEQIVGKPPNMKNSEARKASPKPQAKKPKSSSVPLWEKVS